MPTTVELSIHQLPHWFDGLIAGFKDMDYQDQFELMIEELVQSHRWYFENETGPDREPWPPLAPATVARKGHDRILYETGRLHESLGGSGTDGVRLILDDRIVFGTDVEYSEFLQERRPHVGITPEQLDRFAEMIAQAAIDGMKDA